MHGEAVSRYGRDIKYFLYGHSMGSFVTRCIYSIPEYSGEFDGFVFASTMGPNPAVGLAKFLAGAGCALGSEKKVNKMLTGLSFGGYLKRIPDAIFVVDPKKEHICIQEAQTLGITLFGICDTNCDPEELDYVIPGNDDAIRAVKLIVSKMADAIIEGKQGEESISAEEAESAAAEEEQAAEGTV